MDALVTRARAAVATIPSGSTGAERGLRSAADLLPEEFPHLFVHSPVEEIELLDFQQERRTTSCTMSLVTYSDSQEDLALKLDAIRDQIATYRTLSGIVDFATVSRREISESAVSHLREGILVVTTVKVS